MRALFVYSLRELKPGVTSSAFIVAWLFIVGSLEGNRASSERVWLVSLVSLLSLAYGSFFFKHPDAALPVPRRRLFLAKFLAIALVSAAVAALGLLWCTAFDRQHHVATLAWRWLMLWACCMAVGTACIPLAAEWPLRVLSIILAMAIAIPMTIAWVGLAYLILTRDGFGGTWLLPIAAIVCAVGYRIGVRVFAAYEPGVSREKVGLRDVVRGMLGIRPRARPSALDRSTVRRRVRRALLFCIEAAEALVRYVGNALDRLPQPLPFVARAVWLRPFGILLALLAWVSALLFTVCPDIFSMVLFAGCSCWAGVMLGGYTLQPVLTRIPPPFPRGRLFDLLAAPYLTPFVIMAALSLQRSPVLRSASIATAPAIVALFFTWLMLQPPPRFPVARALHRWLRKAIMVLCLAFLAGCFLEAFRSPSYLARSLFKIAWVYGQYIRVVIADPSVQRATSTLLILIAVLLYLRARANFRYAEAVLDTGRRRVPGS